MGNLCHVYKLHPNTSVCKETAAGSRPPPRCLVYRFRTIIDGFRRSTDGRYILISRLSGISHWPDVLHIEQPQISPIGSIQRWCSYFMVWSPLFHNNNASQLCQKNWKVCIFLCTSWYSNFLDNSSDHWIRNCVTNKVGLGSRYTTFQLCNMAEYDWISSVCVWRIWDNIAITWCGRKTRSFWENVVSGACDGFYTLHFFWSLLLPYIWIKSCWPVDYC